jgi:nucleoid DNA-binding protein
MTKHELIVSIAKTAGCTRKVAEDVMDTLTGLISHETFNKKQKVPFGDLGVFYVKDVAPRTFRDPRDGTLVPKPAKRVLMFKVPKIK